MTARTNGAPVRRATRTAKPAANAAGGLSFASVDLAAGDRFPLFEVDGAEYSMPARIPPGYAVAAQTLLRQFGDDRIAQTVYLVREFAGPDALRALLGSDADRHQWRALTDLIWPRVFGQLEELTSGK